MRRERPYQRVPRVHLHLAEPGEVRRLEEREERYRVLVENANDLIFITDAEGRFTYVNPIASATIAQIRHVAG